MPELLALLADHWGLRSASAAPLSGGMNSNTWMVEHEGSSYVAKQVAADGLDALERGCEVAAMLAEAGLRTGRPVPTSDGELVHAGARLALLEHVTGGPLAGHDEREQRIIGETLARVHHLGSPAPGTGTSDFLERLGVGDFERPGWLDRVVDEVRAETDDLAVTWSILHTDPAPEAFVHDGDAGVTGLIDWAGAVRGPALYGVASAVMYLGGPERARVFLATYRAEGPLAAGELRHLDAFRRFRWKIQALYFSHRISVSDLTGLDDASGNVKGLEDAQRGLAALGVTGARSGQGGRP